jgi:hypothetical protein
MRLGPVSLSKDAAQVWPQLVARHSDDALDLDHKLGIDKGLTVAQSETVSSGRPFGSLR